MGTISFEGNDVDLYIYDSGLLGKLAGLYLEAPGPMGRYMQWCQKVTHQVHLASARALMKKRGFPEPRTIRQLAAHGGVIDGRLMYGESNWELDKLLDVEDWIAMHDGKYDALVLDLCNVQFNDGKMVEGIIPNQPENSFIMYPTYANRPTLRWSVFLGFSMDSYKVLTPKNHVVAQPEPSFS